MIDSEIIKISKPKIENVSHETLDDLQKYAQSILEKNKEINLISSSTEKTINTRHIEDSAQIIEFIDRNKDVICTDIGSGAGLPGIVIAILMKSKNPEFKVILYEKSYHKSNFLKNISKRLHLNTQVCQKNIFNQKDLETDIIIARAFKPLPVIFDIALNNFKKFKYIILFLGKSGKEILNEALKKWNFDYEEKKSLTNNMSMTIKIYNLVKKNG